MNQILRERPVQHQAALWISQNFSNGSKVDIALYGAMFGEDQEANWSLAPLQNSGDEKKPESELLVKRVGKIASAFRVLTLLAPNPTKFNGAIVTSPELTQHLQLTQEITLFRGTFADGIELPVQHGMILSAGGCPLITASYDGRVITAHAGLESLFSLNDPNRPSVVDNIVRRFGLMGSKQKGNLEVRIDFAIPPKEYIHSFRDPQWSEKNQRLCNTLTHRWGESVLWGNDRTLGCIDLFELIKRQFAQHGHAHVEHGMYLPDDISLQKRSQVVAYHTRKSKPHCDRRNLIIAVRTE